jgi:hypothetical protein
MTSNYELQHHSVNVYSKPAVTLSRLEGRERERERGRERETKGEKQWGY